MATSFPTSIDNFTNPTASSLLTSPSHSGQHADINDAVEAIETQIGTTAAPVLARLASPTFTGTPAAPTAAVGTNTTQIATTAFVVANQLGIMPMVSTYYYKTASGATTGTMPENRTNFLPFFIVESTTFDRIAIRTSSTFSGTATVRLGIYNSSGGQPSTVSLDAGTVSCTAASIAYTITISHTLTPGLYFLANNTQTAATINNYQAANRSYTQMPVATTPGTEVTGGWTESVNVTSGFATAASFGITNTPADVWIRKA